MKIFLFCLILSVTLSRAQTEDEDDFEETASRTPCWPSSGQLIKRANEDCAAYAKRVCQEAKAHEDSKELEGCSQSQCEKQTMLRCPFRDLTRARANNFIKAIAKAGNIWKKEDATRYCKQWYGGELANVTRLGSVWDALSLLPCAQHESTIRNKVMSKCFNIVTQGIAPSHPEAKFCYNSNPIFLAGQPVSTQCCYGSDLKLLVLGHKGAGSVSLSSQLAQHDTADADHFNHDLFPRLACCALSDSCYQYSAVRPASLKPETQQEVEESCKFMVEKYGWKPYQDHSPPYAKRDVTEAWKDLKLDASSLVPTERLNHVLQRAQKVRARILKGQEPYEDETTQKPETDAPETDAPETDAPETDAPSEKPETDEPERKTDAPEHETDAPETDEPERKTDAPEHETDAPTNEPEHDETDAPEQDDKKEKKKKKKKSSTHLLSGSSSDRAIDDAIAAVLKGQVEKSGEKLPSKGSSKKGSSKKGSSKEAASREEKKKSSSAASEAPASSHGSSSDDAAAKKTPTKDQRRHHEDDEEEDGEYDRRDRRHRRRRRSSDRRRRRRQDRD